MYDILLELNKEATKDKKYLAYLEAIEATNMGLYKPHPIFNNISETIPLQGKSQLKRAFALSCFHHFMSCFRINVELSKGSAPVNSSTFVLAVSGDGKDRLHKAVKQVFVTSQKLMTAMRNKYAIDDAGDAGEARIIVPTDIAFSTQEGIMRLLGAFHEDVLGVPNIYSGEIGAELKANNSITPIFKLVAEVYDVGEKDVKVLASNFTDKGTISKATKGIPINTLFVSSPENIYFEPTVRAIMTNEFITRFGRRSLFILITSEEEPSIPTTMKEVVERATSYRAKADIAFEIIEKQIEGVTTKLLKRKTKFLNEIALPKHQLEKSQKRTNHSLKVQQTIPISKGLKNLYAIIEEFSVKGLLHTFPIPKGFKITELSVKHAHWRILKLATALALFDNKPEVDVEAYAQAQIEINAISSDIYEFEKQLKKQPHELLLDVLKSKVDNREASLTFHEMKQMGFVSGSGKAVSQAKELLLLVNSMPDIGGSLVISETCITYMETLPDAYSVCYHVDNFELLDKITDPKERKTARIKLATTGYITKTIKFEDFMPLLEYYCTYSHFIFTNGVRNSENCLNSATNFLILDVDQSDLDYSKVHTLVLSSYKHIIATTSNKTNPNKYRVILALSSFITVNNATFRKLYQLLGVKLGLKLDSSLSKTTPFATYPGGYVLSNLEGELYNIQELVLTAITIVESNEADARDKLDTPKAEKVALLANSYNTFKYAYESQEGNRQSTLYRAMQHSKDLGATKDQALDIMESIIDYKKHDYLLPDEIQTLKASMEGWLWIN